MFNRNDFSLLYFMFYLRYNAIVNENTINKIHFLKLKKLFVNEDKKCRNNFLHNVLDKYHKENYKYTFHYLEHLKRLIKKLNISLNFIEEQKLIGFEEHIFTLSRIKKNLETNLELNHKEGARAIFNNAIIYKMDNDLYHEFFSGILTITNQRLIFNTKDQFINIEYSKMKQINFAEYGFMFNIKNAKFVVRIHDQNIINITIKKIMPKIKTSNRRKHVNQKRKNSKS